MFSSLLLSFLQLHIAEKVVFKWCVEWKQLTITGLGLHSAANPVFNESTWQWSNYGGKYFSTQVQLLFDICINK